MTVTDLTLSLFTRVCDFLQKTGLSTLGLITGDVPGKPGINVMTRLMGKILTAQAVEVMGVGLASCLPRCGADTRHFRLKFQAFSLPAQG